jgi:hypothetical protein
VERDEKARTATNGSYMEKRFDDYKNGRIQLTPVEVGELIMYNMQNSPQVKTDIKPDNGLFKDVYDK